MSSDYNLECPHCKLPALAKPADYYGKVSVEEYEAKKLEISNEELMACDSLCADAELHVIDGKLVVEASCYCTICGAQCNFKFSKKIQKGKP